MFLISLPTFVFTPTNASGVAARTLTVSQAAAVATLSTNATDIAAEAQTVAVSVTADAVVEWEIMGVPGWMTLDGTTGRKGADTVTLQVSVWDETTWSGTNDVYFSVDGLSVPRSDGTKLNTANLCVFECGAR